MKYSIKELITDKISGEWGDESVDGDGYKVLRTTNFTNLGKINFENVIERKIDEKKVNQKHLKNGDVIIEKSGGSPTQPVGRVVFFDLNINEKYLCNNFSAILRPNSDLVYSKYFFYQLHLLHTRGRTLKYQNKTTGIINLKLDNYLEEEIEVPPIPDQIHIATVLTKAENLITQRKESIHLLDEYLKRTFLEMFGDPVWNEKGWEKRKLKDVCDRITDGTHFSPPIKEEGIPYVTAKHVRENKIDFFSNPWFISEQDHKDIYRRCDPKKGDVLYIKDGATTGYAAINKYDFEFSMLSSLALLKPNKTICNSEYLCAWLNNPIVKSRILLGMAGGAIQRLTLTKINELPINLPNLSHQTSFAQIVEKTEALNSRYQQSLHELENLYGSLSQRAFKGELNFKDEKLMIAAESGSVYKRKS